WDGVGQGRRPNLYNAIKVRLADAKQQPPAWRQTVVFTGKLVVTQDPTEYPDRGIVSIVDAVRGVPGQGGLVGLIDAGPILSVAQEVNLLIALLATWLLATHLCLGRGNRTATSSGDTR
ncbi:MAG: hypothetical protein GY700_15030, partial [Propionibacteriaceae bacterium]|nr:hypothetical protein [Propionibacteriaceae bacterium]